MNKKKPTLLLLFASIGASTMTLQSMQTTSSSNNENRYKFAEERNMSRYARAAREEALNYFNAFIKEHTRDKNTTCRT